MPVEPVVPLCEQSRAQHKRAVATSEVRFSTWAAFSQQSIPAIAGMLQPGSLACRGMPAETLLPITRTRASDARRVTMFLINLWKPLRLVKECFSNRTVQRDSKCNDFIDPTSWTPCVCTLLWLKLPDKFSGVELHGQDQIA